MTDERLLIIALGACAGVLLAFAMGYRQIAYRKNSEKRKEVFALQKELERLIAETEAARAKLRK